MDYKRIHTELKKWKSKNEISLEMSQKGLVANLLEELTEYVRAENEGDVIMQIDALCDVAVFCLNAMDEYVETPKPMPKDAVLFTIDAIMETYSVQKYYSNDEDDLPYVYSTIVQNCMYNIERLGFNPEKCMNETIKQISSRTGKMDYGIGKWVKDKSPEARAREYQADYESCRK